MLVRRFNHLKCHSISERRIASCNTNILKQINQYNDNILILRDSVKNSIRPTESIYNAVYHDQLEELYVAIADLKLKIENIIEAECPCDDVDAGPCKTYDI